MDFTSWNGKLLAFVQGRLSTPLDIIDAGKILDGKANGGGFLTGAGKCASGFFAPVS